MKHFVTTIGNAVSTLFLGDSRELIVRTDEAVRRIDVDFAEVKRAVRSLERRLSRIEGRLHIAPFENASPTRLTKMGGEILEKSGMRDIVDRFRIGLLEEIKKREPETAYDAEEATREVFHSFDFGEENVRLLKDYAFRSGKWGLVDILEVGAVYFREVVLSELGFEARKLE